MPWVHSIDILKKIFFIFLMGSPLHCIKERREERVKEKKGREGPS